MKPDKDIFDVATSLLGCTYVLLGLFLCLVVLAIEWFASPWFVLVNVLLILAFLFVPALRRWQDEYTPGWDWTKRKN
jgi:hypothetical protein